MTKAEFKEAKRKYEVDIPYHDGYADAEAHYLKLIEDIKAEIEALPTIGWLDNPLETRKRLVEFGKVLATIDQAIKECDT